MANDSNLILIIANNKGHALRVSFVIRYVKNLFYMLHLGADHSLYRVKGSEWIG